MAEIKWIKITTNMFESKQIVALRDFPDGDSALIAYLRFLFKAKRHKGRRFFYSIAKGYELTDSILAWILEKTTEETRNIIATLEQTGLIIRGKDRIEVFRFWEGEQRNRNAPEYIEWRREVFERDGWKCQMCGSGGKLNAHHIERWAGNKELRFEVSNGQTLCERCHKMLHKPE